MQRLAHERMLIMLPVRTVPAVEDEGEFAPGKKKPTLPRPEWPSMDRKLSPDERAYLWKVR
jgi:hypothetical protein